jgi:hypothetical protein
MSEIKIPEALHHSHQVQQMDLGETVYLFAGPVDTRMSVGEIYNFDDLPCLEEEVCEDFEMIAIATADKIVLAYNSHDTLLAACEALDAFEGHTANCGDCDEWGPGNCKEGQSLYSKACDLNGAALDKAKPKGETR